MSRKLYNPRLLERGYIQVYTGDGKMKTTASLGLAVRFIGHGGRVATILFTKGENPSNPGYYGEINSIKKFLPKKLWLVEQFGVPKVLYYKDVDPEILKELNNGLVFAKKIINGGQHSLVVLDEVNICLDMGIFDVDDFITLLKNKPKHVEIVLTGRITRSEILTKIVDVAHLVSDVRSLKHYWNIGIPARKGIEF